MNDPRPVDAVFLDAGNTLLGMNHALIASELGAVGWEFSTADVSRAESRARRVVSDFLDASSGGEARSSENHSTREVYIGALLDELELKPADRGGAVERLVPWLEREENIDRLWSVVDPGCAETLAELGRRGVRRVVVSNSDGEIDRRLREAGLRDELDEVVDSGRVGVEKPDPEIFRVALEIAGVPAERAIHVGDIVSVDVAGARAAGVEGWLIDPWDTFEDFDGPRIRRITELPERLGGRTPR